MIAAIGTDGQQHLQLAYCDYYSVCALTAERERA